MVAGGKIVPMVDSRRFGLDAVGEAHAALAARTAAGKIVIDISTDGRS